MTQIITEILRKKSKQHVKSMMIHNDQWYFKLFNWYKCLILMFPLEHDHWPERFLSQWYLKHEMKHIFASRFWKFDVACKVLVCWSVTVVRNLPPSGIQLWFSGFCCFIECRVEWRAAWQQEQNSNFIPFHSPLTNISSQGTMMAGGRD